MSMYRSIRRWGQQKPVLGAVLDPSHSLSQGLVGRWLFNDGAGNTNGSILRDATGLHNGTYQVSPADASQFWTSGYDGPAYRVNGTNLEYWACNGLGSFDSNNWTLYVRIANIVNVGPQRFICWGDGGPTIWFNTGTPGTLAIVHSGTIDLSFSWSYSLGRVVPYSLVIARSGSSASIWVDGIKQASSSTFSVTYTPSANIEIARGGASLANLAKCDFLGAGMWSRGLSAAEIQSLHLDPYAMIAPPSPRRFYSIPAATSARRLLTLRRRAVAA